ncbi:MAG: hypothetical protein JSW66_01275 [Phycisphaerales bacterium]|nr:MAG: hypothetical protein JSW66_01275 [Phycisphaerales bacterium]
MRRTKNMQKRISNIVFTRNRPLQLEAYLESLYRHFPRELIQTYIIYKVELFAQEYAQVFKTFPDCVVTEEADFHSDFMRILDQVNTKYILFGIDDVVLFDPVGFEVIDRTFAEQGENVFGFTLRFSPESLKDSGDLITECTVAGEPVYRLNWKNGQTPHTRYPFELCCTFYATDLVRTIICRSMNPSPVARCLFKPGSALIKASAKVGRKRSVLKRFGYFFSPNTLESWPCRWCWNHSEQLPGYTYFQKICATAIQVNRVNTSTKNAYYGTDEHTVEALNDKYRQGYRLDIDYVAESSPTEPGCGPEHFRLMKRSRL